MSEIARNQSFESRMKERIRDSIGELLTDEELSNMVHRSMEEIFFKPREYKDGFRTKEKEPLIHELLIEHLEPFVREQIKSYISENKEEINRIIRETIQDGVSQCVIKSVNRLFQESLFNLQTNIESQIHNMS